MATLVFDTHDFITGLTEAGMDEAQAKRLSDELRKIHLDQVATKHDLRLLESALTDNMSALQEKMAGLSDSMKDGHSGLLKWFTGILMAHAALVAALVKLI